MPAPGPLRGLQVLELATGVAGPYAARLLAMLGASVVKVEPAGGDPARRVPVDDGPAPAVSPLFVHLNTGKRLLPHDPATVCEELARADVVVAAGPVESLLDQLRGRDRAVVATTTDGEPGDELVVQAASGLMTATGDDGREPLRFPGWQSQYLAGAYLAASTLALLGRGGVHHVHVPWVGAMASGVESGLCAYLQPATREGGGPGGDAALQVGFQAGAFPSGAFACKDGHVVPGTVRPVDWELQCKVYDRHDLVADERFTWRRRWENRAALRAELEPWYRARTKRDVFHAALEAGWAAAMVMTAGDALEDDHLAARGFLAPVEVDGVAAVTPARPWRVEPEAGAGEPAPFAAADVRGLRVLELTWAWAGPFVGRFLGALGADVVRVEAGRYPDGWRTRLRWQDAGVDVPADVDPDAYTWDAAALYNSLNRNKRGVSVDLTTDEGRAVFLDLVAAADVLVANMTYSVLRDRGVEREVHAAVEGRGLVFVNMPALGATGPYRDMPGYGMLMEGMGGFAARFGYRDEGARASATYYPDAVAGVHGCVAVLSALARRASTGAGAVVDLSQQETTWLQLGEGIALRATEGREPGRLGNAEPGCWPSGVYPTAGGGWVAVVGRAEPPPGAGRDDVDEVVAAWTRRWTAEEITACLAAVGVRAEPVRRFEAVHRDGILADHGLLEHHVHPVTGRRAYLALPVLVDGEPLAGTRPAPTFGQHTDEVLAAWAGYDEAERRRLRECGAVGTTPTVRR